MRSTRTACERLRTCRCSQPTNCVVPKGMCLVYPTGTRACIWRTAQKPPAVPHAQLEVRRPATRRSRPAWPRLLSVASAVAGRLDSRCSLRKVPASIQTARSYRGLRASINTRGEREMEQEGCEGRRVRRSLLDLVVVHAGIAPDQLWSVSSSQLDSLLTRPPVPTSTIHARLALPTATAPASATGALEASRE